MEPSSYIEVLRQLAERISGGDFNARSEMESGAPENVQGLAKGIDTLAEKLSHFRQKFIELDFQSEVGQDVQVILDGLPDVVLLIDAHLEVLTWNQPAELIGKPEKGWPSFLDKSSRAPAGAALETMLTSQPGVTGQLQSRLACDEERVYLWDLVMLGDAGVLVSGRDISDLQDAQDQLQETQTQLLQKDKMASIGQLAAGVAHEINNPLGFIISNLNSLQEFFPEIIGTLRAYKEGKTEKANAMWEQFNGEVVLELLENAIRDSIDGSERVRDIVGNLKEFSHTDAGEREVTDLHTCIDSTLKICLNEIKYKAEIRKEFGEIPAVDCFPRQLNQVFLNILVNAAHAIPDQGIITIRTGMSEDGNGANGEVFVEFHDNGSGMPENVKKRLFDPFFTTKEIGTGTGLGLHLSHKIIASHKGRIEVESKEGQGTTFRIVLPIKGGVE